MWLNPLGEGLLGDKQTTEKQDVCWGDKFSAMEKETKTQGK